MNLMENINVDGKASLSFFVYFLVPFSLNSAIIRRQIRIDNFLPRR